MDAENMPIIQDTNYIEQKIAKHEQEKEIKYLRDRVKQLEMESEKQVAYFTDNSVEKQLCSLLVQFNELQEEKLDLETRFAMENTRFFELVEKLKDKLRLIALSTIEMESKIRILNAKVPELEQTCQKHDKTIDSLIYRFKNQSFTEIKNLENSLKATEENIKHLEMEIARTKKKNAELNTEIDNITADSQSLQNRFDEQRKTLKENIMRLENDNTHLEKRIEEIVHNDNANFDRQMEILKKEIDALSHQIKKARKEKIGIMEENEGLKKEVKRLVLNKVISSRSHSLL